MDLQYLILATEPPEDPSTQGSELRTYLGQFSNHHIIPYIHPKAVSFRDARHRANWGHYIPDAYTRDTISEFYCSNKGGKSCWVGFFSSETANWVANPGWNQDYWHCFTIAIIQSRTGKVLVIYDPDPYPGAVEDGQRPRSRTILRGLQRALVDWIQKTRTRRLSLWYSADRSTAGDSKCLVHALKRVEAWARLGDLE